MSINTKANTSKPFYPQASFLSCNPPDSKFKYLAVKAAQDLSILQLYNDEIEVLHTLTLSELKINEGFIPNAFEFINGKTVKESQLLIAYENGSILIMDFLKKDIATILNPLPSAITHNLVSQIIISCENNKEVFILFEDSSLIKYNTTYEENSSFINKMEKFDKKTNFNLKINRFKYKHKENDFIEAKRLLHEQIPEMNYFILINKPHSNLAYNPQAFYKFNCSFISYIETKSSPFFQHINAKPSKSNTSHYAVLAFTGFDGFLRIFDYFWMTPLISYRSNYGGYNHFSFSNKGDLIALCGHDDNITVLDLITFRTITIIGHKSFPMKVMLSEIEPFIIRVLACSLDTFISVSEFDRRIFNLEEDNNSRKEDTPKKFPMRILYKDDEKTCLKPLYFLKVSKEGIPSFNLFEGYLFVSAYDGMIGVWSFQEKETHREAMIINDKTPFMIKENAFAVEKKNIIGETIEDDEENSEIQGSLAEESFIDEEQEKVDGNNLEGEYTNNSDSTKDVTYI